MAVVECETRLAGGTAVLPRVGPSRVDLLIRDGVISGIVPASEHVVASTTIDCTGLHILPGVVDAHVHLGANITYPAGRSEVLPETQAAAAGGVTTLLAYLMSAEPYEEIFDRARVSMDESSLIDFGFHFCVVTPEQLAHVPHYVSKLGVSSFKIFMNFRGDEGAYLGLPGNDDGFLVDLLSVVAESGGMVNPHTENIELIWRLARHGIGRGRTDLEEWCRLRPDYVEAEAAGRVAFFAEVTGASVYVVHITNRLSVEILEHARERYDSVFVETCPHYLTLDHDSPCGIYGKVNPPLRSAADREALWAALANGMIDVVGSDHVSRHRSFKEKDLRQASAGFPGLQTLLPLLLSEGHLARGIPLSLIVDCVATRPATLFGLYPQKGAIQVGADADLAFVDLEAADRIEARSQYSGAEYTPWEGTEIACSVRHTMLRGTFVYRDGALTSEPPAGTYVARRASGHEALVRAGL